MGAPASASGALGEISLGSMKSAMPGEREDLVDLRKPPREPLVAEAHVPDLAVVESPEEHFRVLYYHVDPNGCPTRITDGRGNALWSASFAAWGSITVFHAQGVDNPIRYQGQYCDQETGLQYNRYRYYETSLGEFGGQDPIGILGGVGLYDYAPNANLWADPLGLSKIDPKTGVLRMPRWLPAKWGWERQHIIPFSVWRDALPELEKIGLTMQDVNGAHNMMYMPRFPSLRPSRYPNMGLHRGFHPLHKIYNDRVRAQIKALFSGMVGMSDTKKLATLRAFQMELRNGTRKGTFSCAK